MIEEEREQKSWELNVAAWRRCKSPKTGYVHALSAPELIPLLENYASALALFRSRALDAIDEGKALLEKLLAFEVEGNFPVYLHEYPQCKHRGFGLELLPVFHALVHDCAPALGQPLLQRLKKLIGRVISFAYLQHTQRPLALGSAYRLFSYLNGFADEWTPSSAQEWAHRLITDQMRGVSLLSPPWDRSLCLYLGMQAHEGQEPQVTTLDLLMGSRSLRARKDLSSHLQAGILYPQERVMSSQEIEGIRVCGSQVYWGSVERIDSCEIEGPLASVDHCEQSIQWRIALPQTELKDDKVECSLFFNISAVKGFYVAGQRASAFSLGETLTVQLLDKVGTVRITLEEGDETGQERFFCHLLRGNRPSQQRRALYEAADWQIAVRTLHRKRACTLKVAFTVQASL